MSVESKIRLSGADLRTLRKGRNLGCVIFNSVPLLRDRNQAPAAHHYIVTEQP